MLVILVNTPDITVSVTTSGVAGPVSSSDQHEFGD